jgi:hypothetical protein
VQGIRELRIDWLVVALTLAFTAVPLQLRVPHWGELAGALHLHLLRLDFMANVAGYLPAGIVLARQGMARGLALACAISCLAEAAQLFSAGRGPSVMDVIANTLGAAAGLLLATRWPILPARLRLGPRSAGAAAIVAVAYAAFGTGWTVESIEERIRVAIEAPPWLARSAHGRHGAGEAEAHWSFDSLRDGAVADSSGKRMSGKAMNGPVLSSGVAGRALSLDGKQWIDFGSRPELRFTGSMTLSAWVRPRAFPVDDAAIISSLSPRELGYQLDLTVDNGPRTIGFKLADATGRIMARYGVTPLQTDRWYHVAGVYDAAARTLHVYLDGQLDDGCERGTVTWSQHISSSPVRVGARGGLAGFEFNGLVDEARIDSRPLSAAQVRTLFDTDSRGRTLQQESPGPGTAARAGATACRLLPVRVPRVPGPLTALGMLVALVCAGLCRGARIAPALCVVASLAAGVVVTSWNRFGVDLAPHWLPVLFTLLGGVAVVAAARVVASPHSDR